MCVCMCMSSTGQVAYAGRRDQAVDYFAQNLGLNCPQFYNPADYLIEKLAVNVMLEKPEVPIETILDAYRTSELCQKNNEWLADMPVEETGLTASRLVATREFPASTWTQFVQSYKRTLKSYAR